MYEQFWKKDVVLSYPKLQEYYKSTDLYLEVCVVHMFEDQSRSSGLKKKGKKN